MVSPLVGVRGHRLVRRAHELRRDLVDEDAFPRLLILVHSSPRNALGHAALFVTPFPLFERLAERPIGGLSPLVHGCIDPIGRDADPLLLDTSRIPGPDSPAPTHWLLSAGFTLKPGLSLHP